jgi:hypothetical protein
VRLTYEIEGNPAAGTLPGDGAALVAFMSFAVVRGFGAQHPLIALADRLHDQHHVRMGPLTTFYEASPEDAEDREKIDMAWQAPADLRAALEAFVTALTSGDDQVESLLRRAETPGLPAEAEALLAATRDAEAHQRRIRLLFEL